MRKPATNEQGRLLQRPDTTSEQHTVSARYSPSSPTSLSSSRVELPETDLPRTIVTPNEVTDSPELLARGRALYARGEFRDAAKVFEQIIAVDPDGAWVGPALFHAALAREQLGDLTKSAQHFAAIFQRNAEPELARDGLARAIRVYAHLEDWANARALSGALLSHYSELGLSDRVLAHSATAMALINEDKLDAAAYHVEKARSLIESRGLDRAPRISRDVAQAYFALGELRRLAGEAIRFTPVTSDFPVLLERRCQLLLDAQSAYADSMRAYDAHWSAMAGYRVGELYSRLHDDLMAIPTPDRAKTERQRQLFQGAMRLRFSILLEKGLRMLDHTLGMALRTGQRGPWVRRAQLGRERLLEAVEEEERALDQLPFTRADLKQALEGLAGQRIDVASRSPRP